MKRAQAHAATPADWKEATTAVKPPACPPRSQLPSRPPDLHRELARKIEGLPRDVGAMLVGLGAIGVAIPGPIPLGASFVAIGVLFLKPGLILRFAGPIARRCPRLFRFLIAFVDSLRRALERRYPGSVGC